jgi:preprotein translocase subunit SecY
MPDKKQSAWRFLWRSEDIRKKLLITLGILVIFRVAAVIPVPGINTAALESFFQTNGAGFLGFLNLLSGGTIKNFSILAMGVYPYITAQIILQLLVPIIPSLQKRMNDDQREGRKWMEKWTMYLTVPMAMLSAIGQINIFNSLSGTTPIVPFGWTQSLWLSSLTTVLVMTAGTMFAIWLGELISEFGIRGQGLSLIIFAGIVSQIPQNIYRLWLDEQNRYILILAMALVIIGTVLAIVYVQQGRRNVPIMYPHKSQIFYAMSRGKVAKMPQPFLPLMVNLAGMIPLIFASAILQFPGIIASYFVNSSIPWVASFASNMVQFFNPTSGADSWGYWLLYFIMVVAFTYFYTTVIFEQQNYGENLKRSGAQIPGVHSGTATQKYLSRIQSRITLPGAVLLGGVAIMPFLLQLILPGAQQSAGLFLVSSSGLLIVVGVVRDTFMNIEAELKLHGYQEKLLIS